MNVCLYSCSPSSAPQIVTCATSQKNMQHLLHNLPPRSVHCLSIINRINSHRMHGQIGYMVTRLTPLAVPIALGPHVRKRRVNQNRWPFSRNALHYLRDLPPVRHHRHHSLPRPHNRNRPGRRHPRPIVIDDHGALLSCVNERHWLSNCK